MGSGKWGGASAPPAGACPHGIPSDVTDVSQVTVAVIIRAVNNALAGCPA